MPVNWLNNSMNYLKINRPIQRTGLFIVLIFLLNRVSIPYGAHNIFNRKVESN